MTPETVAHPAAPAADARARAEPPNPRIDTGLSGGRRHRRFLFRTRWLGPDDDLTTTVAATTSAHVRPGDTIVVAEKVVVVLTGRAVAASGVRAGRLARFLARQVSPRGNSRGLSIPEKMQYVIDNVGLGRTLLAAAASAVAKPLGIVGVFYRVAGTFARDLDGMRPPYGDLLLPPVPGLAARHLVSELAAGVGHPVAIVDINDRGGSVRAVSPGGLPAETLLELLADNPFGHCDQATPIGVIRPV